MSSGQRSKSRGALWVFGLIGVIIGLAGAMWLTWGVWPVQYFNTDPGDLRPELKQDYLVLVGSSFGVNQDLQRAQRRLRWLGWSDEEAARSLVSLTKKFADSGTNVALARGMSKLAYALGARDGQILVFLVTPTPTLTSTPTETPEPTDTPVPTATSTETVTPRWTPRPTPADTAPTSRFTPAPTATTEPATETPVPLPDYEVISSKFSCQPRTGKPTGTGLLEVRVRADGRAVPVTTALSVLWEGDDDEFFTGLSPDQGLDYADFEMQPGIDYVLTVDHGRSQPVKIAFRDKDCVTGVVTGTLPVWDVVFQKRKVLSTN